MYPSGHSIFIKRYIILDGDLSKTQLWTKLNVKMRRKKKKEGKKTLLNYSFKAAYAECEKSISRKSEFYSPETLFGGRDGRTGEGAGEGRGAVPARQRQPRAPRSTSTGHRWEPTPDPRHPDPGALRRGQGTAGPEPPQ